MRKNISFFLAVFVNAFAIGVSSSALVAVWTLVLIFSNILQHSLHTFPAFLTGFIVGFFIPFLKERAKLHVAFSAVYMVIVWMFLTRMRAFELPFNNIWGIMGTLFSFGGLGMLVYYLPQTSIEENFNTRIIRSVLWMLKILGYLFFFFIVVFPFYFMIAASTKPRAELLNNPLDLRILFSRGLQYIFVGYIDIIRRFHFARYIINSFILSISTIILTLIPAVSGAYAVTRLHFPGRVFFSKAILIVYMFPAILIAIPLYSITSQIGIRNSLLSLMLIYPAMTIPVALYMLRSYFFTLPRDIEDAAMIDGCNRVQVIFRVILPLSVPALTSVALYVFMIAWNEFLFSFMLIDSPVSFTLSRGIASLNTQETPRQFLMAGSLIITLPVIVIMFWLEKFLVGGLTLGSVKE